MQRLKRRGLKKVEVTYFWISSGVSRSSLCSPVTMASSSLSDRISLFKLAISWNTHHIDKKWGLMHTFASTVLYTDRRSHTSTCRQKLSSCCQLMRQSCWKWSCGLCCWCFLRSNLSDSRQVDTRRRKMQKAKHKIALNLNGGCLSTRVW